MPAALQEAKARYGEPVQATGTVVRRANRPGIDRSPALGRCMDREI
jgi:hypothetical protein